MGLFIFCVTLVLIAAILCGTSIVVNNQQRAFEAKTKLYEANAQEGRELRAHELEMRQLELSILQEQRKLEDARTPNRRSLPAPE